MRELLSSIFMSGYASAVFMSGAMKGLTPDNLTDSQKADLVFSATLIGGASSIITGGSYLRGAMIGYSIAVFNYLEEETVEESFPISPNMEIVRFAYYSGNVCAELQNFIATPRIPTYFFTSKGYISNPFESASFVNSCIDSHGQSLAKYGANSTAGIGNNIQVYWKTATQRPFYGNQYISTQKLTTVGSNIVSKTTKASNIIGLVQVGIGAIHDIADLSCYGHTDMDIKNTNYDSDGGIPCHKVVCADLPAPKIYD